jgi:hypothetical protein
MVVAEIACETEFEYERPIRAMGTDGSRTRIAVE